MSQVHSVGSVFWSLVRNDMKRGWHRSRPGNPWGKFYLAFAIIIGLILYTWAALKGLVRAEFILAYLPALFIIPAIFGLQGIKREWRSGTAGWWLALPYSRRLLLGAKCLAGFLRNLLVILIFLFTALLLGLEAVLLRPDLWSWHVLGNTFGLALFNFALPVICSPFLILAGNFLGILQHSKWRPALPLFWVLFIFLMGIASSLRSKSSAPRYPFYLFQPADFLYGLGALGLAVILYFLAAYVLDRQTEA